MMTIGVGIVGFAHCHVNAYCRAWREDAGMGVEVLAGWDHDAARLATSAETLGLRGHESLDELLARDDIEAVVVASETSLHAELVEKAAARGKAIVLQKPMAVTMFEADRIVDAVMDNDVPFSMAWQMRVDPQNVRMKELLDGGSLGQVFMVRRRHGLSMGLDPTFEESWHVNPDLNRDLWADDAAHPIDFMHWLLGAPESVTAEIESLYNPKIPMDNGIAVFRYPGGPLAEVCCSFTNPAGENTTEIVCEKGTIIQNYGDATSCNVPRPDGAVGLKWYVAAEEKWVHSDIVTPPDHGHRIAALSESLALFLHGRGPAVATALEGRLSLRMLLACYLSSREGRRVDLADEAIKQI